MGRGRSVKVDAAIVSSTLAVIADHGIEGFSVEEVALRAEVGKATIYRRYADRQELISSALETLNDDLPSINRKGSAINALIEMLEWVRTSRTSGGDLLPRILAQTKSNPELFEVCHDRVIHPRWERFHQVLKLGVERGELRADLDIDIACTMLLSPVLMFNMMQRHQDQPAPKDFVARLVRHAVTGMAALPTMTVSVEAAVQAKPARSKTSLLRGVLSSDS